MTPDASPPRTRRLIPLLGTACFAGALNARVMDPFVLALAVEFTTSPERAALVASAYALPFALIQPILGPVGDALGKPGVIRAGLAMLAVFTLVSPLAPGLGTLLVLRALAGAASGGIMPLSLALVGDAVPLKERQVALSRLLAFAIGGQIGGGVLAGMLGPWLGWRGVVWLCAGMVVLAALPVGLFPLSATPERRGRFDPVRALRGYGAILRMPAARLLYAAVLVEGVLVFGSFPYFAPMLTTRNLADAGSATMVAGMAVAAFGCGGFVYAAVARTLLARLGQGRMVLLGGGLVALAMLGFGMAPLVLFFVTCGLLLGAGFYMIHNSIQTRVTEVAPEARGSAFALHASHFFIGQSLGPVLMGLAFARVGAAATMAMAALGIFGLSLALWKGNTPGTS
jgi:predicted MFS family arabinose efflux permease